jgi:hypothetical protein
VFAGDYWVSREKAEREVQNRAADLPEHWPHIPGNRENMNWGPWP